MVGAAEDRGTRLPGAPSVMEAPPGPKTVIDGRPCLYFGGTGYFGLHGRPELRQAGVRAWERFGLSSATSRLATPLQVEIERTAARFFAAEDAAYLASGYLTNTAGVQALSEDGAFDAVFIDQHAHYCVRDAAATAGVPVHTFNHLDPGDLSRRLARELRPGETPLVMTDGLFPLFGRLAPVPDYLEALAPYGGLLWLDDAHPMGILGDHGRGTCEHFNVAVGATGGVRVFAGGTLSKAFGGFGGILPGPAELIARVRQGEVRIAASPPPTPVAAASLEGLRLVMENPQWRVRLHENARRLKAGLRGLGLEVEPTEVPVAAFVLDPPARMREVHRRLLDRGIAIQYTRYPGVGEAGALRTVVFSTHTAEQIERLIAELARLL